MKQRLGSTQKWPILNVGEVWRNIVPSLALFEQKIVLKGVVHLVSTGAKKVVSDIPRLVDFAIGLVNSVFNLPEGQVMFFEKVA